ncbi:D-glycerate dehydrogenase [Paracoccus sp. SCSIO 75233]|uniref:2-hydroxyacid dehydrogenase n=1 Tax=Paracoccus sp. SCSIO 75233 TaxID=3017782 RepID=UPI0022F06EAA|nr:D-glycerate dehydrogenase [Paracoccus sp. SCSIO 75233]WBU52603.1 D-glycerate dehydrogenase [Paracoccus sp. SCSIO 75233]
MKLLVTRPMTQAAESAISARFEETRFRDTNEPMTLDEVKAALSEYDLIMPTLGDAFRAEAFAAAPPKTKLLANFGAGYNHIDLDAAKAAGVSVTNTPDVVTEATADLAVTLLMMTARRAGEGERLARSGTWQGWNPTQMLGSQVSGRTVGIVGMGRIGRAIAKRLHLGFGMRVVFFNRSPLSSLDFPARQLPSLDEVMRQSDFVVVAVPGGAGTHHLIGSGELDALGKNGIIINIARGDVIDEAALIAALSSGKIRAAGLDVYEQEPVIPQTLREMDNVVLLPHLGTAVETVRTDMALRALDNLIAFSEDKALPDAVI